MGLDAPLPTLNVPSVTLQDWVSPHRQNPLCIRQWKAEAVLAIPVLAESSWDRVRKQDVHPEAESNVCDAWGHIHLSPNDTLAAFAVQQQSHDSAVFPVAWAATPRSAVLEGSDTLQDLV